MATIETRRAADGTTTHRVKIRLKGHGLVSASFARLTDARRWGVQTEASMREGRYFRTSEARRHSLADLVQRYLLEVLPLRPQNAANTKRHLKWWSTRLGTLALCDVTPSVVATCRNELLAKTNRLGKPLAGATVLRYLASLSHAFTIATKDWEWVSDNPVSKISKPRQARGRERYLSDDERHRLLDACRASTSRCLYPVVVLALSTGMRRGEIMGLRWGRVDLARGQLLLTETKNDTSRALPLVGLALEQLTLLAKVRRIDTDLVFHGVTPGRAVDLTKPWETALRKAAIAGFRFHDLRHTAASYLAMNGATTMDIAAVLGHKTLQMVKRYSHLSNSHTAEVVAAMNLKFLAQE